jgi:hypothetical protein
VKVTGFGGFECLQRGFGVKNHRFDFAEIAKGEILCVKMPFSYTNSPTDPIDFVSTNENAKN